MATREEKAEELARYEEEKANWPTHRITVMQTFRVGRTIDLQVKAATHEEALEKVSSGEIEIPDVKDPRWREGWDLENEEYE